MADGENRRIINMVEVTNDFFGTITREFKTSTGTLKPYKACEEEKELLNFINKDDVLRIIKNAVYTEGIYIDEIKEEYIYDTIDEEEAIEEINKLPVILIGIDLAGKEICVGDFFRI